MGGEKPKGLMVDIARGLLQVVGTPRAWEAYRAAGMQRLEEQYT
jgi:hypothetical protein